MQSEHKKWSRQFTGNKRLFHNVKNPLRYYIEQEIKKISLKEFPNRPAQPVDISIGDPTNSSEFKTNPSNIQIIAKNVGKIDGYTKFVGCDEARQSIANMFQSEHYKISKDNVFLTAGGSLAIWASIMVLANEGDNFLFPSPGFPLAGVIADSIGLDIRFYHLDPHDDWKASISQMESLIDNRTKFIYINDPSNPLGACWSQEHKKQIISFAKSKNLPIVADQIYENVTYGQPIKTFAQLATEDVTIFKCSGLTKRWLGPGWRLGWLIVYAKQDVLKYYQTALKHIFNIILMPHTILQASVKGILQNPTNQQYLSSRMKIMGKNQQLLIDGLSSEPYCLVGSASGALYATILMKMQYFDPVVIPNVIQFCKRLYSEQNVMIFPGKFFNSQQTFLRLTISCSNSIIQEFLLRFKRFCHNHLKKQQPKP